MRRRIDASKQAPRGVLSSILISGAVGVVFLLGIILSLKDIPAAMDEGLGGGFPIATTINDNFTTPIVGSITFGLIYLVVILASVFVCTLAIHGAAARMMFSMGRDRHLPLGGLWGSVNSRFRTPANAVVAVGVLAAVPILLVGPLGGFTLSIVATGLIYLSYFLCNLGVAFARRKGWPREKAWFNLGRWGMLVNILALIYGFVMIVNIALWNSTELFGDFGGEGRALVEPADQRPVRDQRAGARLPAGLADLRVDGRCAAGPRWPVLRRVHPWPGARRRGGRSGDRRGRHRLACADPGQRCGAASDRRAAACQERRSPDD